MEATDKELITHAAIKAEIIEVIADLVIQAKERAAAKSVQQSANAVIAKELAAASVALAQGAAQFKNIAGYGAWANKLYLASKRAQTVLEEHG